MRIYVASKFERKIEVREMHDLLRSYGHEITHDWTHEDIGDRTGAIRDDYLAACAANDVRGVRTADAVVVLHDDNGRGKYVEIGIAIGLGIPIVVVGGMKSDRAPIFYRLALMWHVADRENVIAVLDGIASRW